MRIQHTIEEWIVVQSQWLYLDPIFSSPNIIDQMPDEAALFKVVFFLQIVAFIYNLNSEMMMLLCRVLIQFGTM